MKISEHKLKNGINAVVIEYPGAELVSSNVIIHAGGRYEKEDQYGLSHFLEHVAFKGSLSYPKPGQATEIIEGLGGVVNAWTSEQATCYWNILPTEHIDVAVKVLSEQVSALKLDPAEIDNERGPIIEEIKRAHDDPYSYVWHKIYEVMWPNQAISNGVLGPEKNISKFKAPDFRKYMSERYVGENITVCIASSLKKEESLKIIKKYFSRIESGTRTLPETIRNEQDNAQLVLVNREIKQAHILLGYKTFGIEDDRVASLIVLMNILSKGMSSILFKEVREKRGAAYAVEGETDLFSDAGAAMIYAGLNTEKAEEVIVVIKNILRDLTNKPLPINKIEKAKKFIRGITLYRLDGLERTAYWYTTKSLLDRRRLDPKAYLDEINKVTPASVQAVAREIFQPQNESLLILGPYKNKEKFAKILAQTKARPRTF